MAMLRMSFLAYMTDTVVLLALSVARRAVGVARDDVRRDPAGVGHVRKDVVRHARQRIKARAFGLRTGRCVARFHVAPAELPWLRVAWRHAIARSLGSVRARRLPGGPLSLGPLALEVLPSRLRYRRHLRLPPLVQLGRQSFLLQLRHGDHA